jgi:hypothetical protein
VRCLHWTERQHHLAGALGCAIYKRLRELWMAGSHTRRSRGTRHARRPDTSWQTVRNCGRLAIFPVMAVLLLFTPPSPRQ